MASIHKQLGKPFWFCAFITPDGVRRFKSTKTADKKSALQVCRSYEKAAREAKLGKLTKERAREIIAQGVADVYSVAHQESMPSSTVKAWCEQWLETKSIEVTESSLARYNRVIESFLESLGNKAERDIASLQATDVSKWRDGLAKKLSKASANLSLKCLRVCIGDAMKHGFLTVNFATHVKILKSTTASSRRELTVIEIKRVLEHCDYEWKGLVLFGIYTGQRLGDITRLTWRAINMEKREIAFVTRKTGRRMNLPLMKALQDYLATLPAADDPNTPLFPTAASTTRTGTLSNRFRDILADAGLVEPKSHQASKKGRTAKREVSEISFHSLRHSAVTFLKAAGVSDALAREIIGHESAAVSRQYTHLSTDDLRREMVKMPDVTN